jgi:tRNA(fMet)-specific endonuclease VapC
VNYLLDTNAVVALLRNKPVEVRARYRAAQQGGDTIALSSIVLFELWYGAAKSTHVADNVERLRILLTADIDLLDFDDEDAHAAGQIRATLEPDGHPIGAYDLLIAAQAIRRGLTVVTANTAEFSRVTGLSLADWTTGG